MSNTTSTAPQLTFRAILLSIILAVILAAANTYLGLFAGLTISSSIPAAVVSMAVLKLLGGGHILENNIVQTGASAAASIAAGVIFTIPALVILGYWSDFRYSWVLAIAGLGGILGVLFSVPLRRALIIEQNLTFPEGRCAAEVLKAGEDPAHGVKLLAGSAVLGGVVKLLAASGARLIPDSAAAASYVGKGIAYTGTNLSPALLGVGYIVGLNIGVVVVGGGIISWNVAIPVYSAFFLDGNPELAARISGAGAEAAANAIWSTQIRYLGVGSMLIGGLWTLVSLRKSILSGVRSGLAATRAGAARVLDHTEQDLPMKPVLIGIVLFALPLLFLYQAIVASFIVSVPMTIIMIVAGFLFCSVSAYMAGVVGSSNNPVSGITIGTILFASLVLILLVGREYALGPVAAIMIGAVVCCAAAVAGDNLQDLKAGQLVGATPWRQQVMLAIGAVLPWGMVWTGAAIGAAIIVLDEMLKARRARYRAPVLAAAVGIYLPLELTVPIFLGGLLAHFVERKAGVGNDPDTLERLHRRGVLFAAGLITGEALMGIVIAIPIVTSGSADVLALPEWLQPGAWGQWLGLALLVVIAALLYRAALSQRPAPEAR